jgi:hypothetical protein
MASTNMGTLIAVIVGIIALVIFLPRIMPQLKGAIGGLGLGSQASAGPGGNVQASGDKTATAGGDSGKMTDVSGNGCACSNGVCEGNCSDMEQIDLENFDPLQYVQQHT